MSYLCVRVYVTQQFWRIDSLVRLSCSLETFCQTSEVDRVIAYEIHQTKYKVMIGCEMDCPPWRLPISFALLWGMVNLSDIPIREMTLISLIRRRIIYYNPMWGKGCRNVRYSVRINHNSPEEEEEILQWKSWPTMRVSLELTQCYTEGCQPREEKIAKTAHGWKT